ncbi:MAG: hypothetical protein IJW52_05740 [Clostridia bacterium]|nr:hypothetical protein [Clostridia bacterium]
MKRYIILIFALICVLLLAGCAGGCNSCRSSTFTPPTIETDPPKTNVTEPPEEPAYVGIGLQEPKYIELAAPQTPSADQAFDALLYNVMASNEYRADANKYYQFTRFNDNILILLSRVDSMICVYDEKTYDVTLYPQQFPQIRELHINGTFELRQKIDSDLPDVYSLYLFPDISDLSRRVCLWSILSNGERSVYVVYEKSEIGYEPKELSQAEFLEYSKQYNAPYVDWCDLNASNIKRVIGCTSPIEQLYPADFEDYESALLTMRGISEICRQGYLHKYTLGLSALQIQNKYADRYENLFKISDESAKETLGELIGLCLAQMPNYNKDHDIKNLFAYCLKDLNGDGKDELLLMRENTFSAFNTNFDSIVKTEVVPDSDTVGGADAPESVTTSYQKYVVFAVMGEVDGKVELLGSYPEGAWIDADGQIIYQNKVERVNDEGRLETVEHFGVQLSSTSMLQITYFRTENGKRIEISLEEYNELSRKYAIPTDQEGYSTEVLRILPKLITEESYVLKLQSSGNIPSTDSDTPHAPDIIIPQ